MRWEPRANPRRDGRGRGVAYTHYKNNETLLAMGMDVEVDAKSGVIRVLRVACAHDCGQIIAPDGVRAQVEGCILQTISRALFEEVKFDRKSVTSTDWVTYPILTIPDAPALDIALIDRPNEPPMGVGEAAASPVGAAIANAVFDATGENSIGSRRCGLRFADCESGGVDVVPFAKFVRQIAPRRTCPCRW